MKQKATTRAVSPTNRVCPQGCERNKTEGRAGWVLGRRATRGRGGGQSEEGQNQAVETWKMTEGSMSSCWRSTQGPRKGLHGPCRGAEAAR